MVKVSADRDRISRYSALPRQIFVSLNISNDQITFDLTENEEINSNVPIHVTDDHGKIIVQQIASSGVRYFSKHMYVVIFEIIIKLK